MLVATQKKTSRIGRSLARLAAIQALYQLDMSRGEVTRVLAEFHNFHLKADIDDICFRLSDTSLFDDIVRGVSQDLTEIDHSLTSHLSSGWSLSRLDCTIRQILRAGAYELRARPGVSTATIINEYLDISHAFFDPREVKFVNGLLDSLARSLRSQPALPEKYRA